MDKIERTPEEELDDIIDALNAGKKPVSAGKEVSELLPALSAVRHLAEPPLPTEELAERVRRAQPNYEVRPKSPPAFKPSLRRMAILGIAATMLAVIGLSLVPRLLGGDVVLAMSRAVEKVTSYHGLMEVRAENAAGDEWMVRRLEIWVDGGKYAVRQDDGTITVNNLERKWQVRPEEAAVAILPVAPDSNTRGIDLRDEAKRALEYPHAVVGEETVAGRTADKVEISPPGGRPYYLWLDKETNLPIQLKTAMTNALETTYTFTELDINGTIDPSVYEYCVPAGFSVVEENAGTAVVTLEEAEAVSGVQIAATEEAPSMILAFPGKVVLVYEDCEVIQETAAGDFEIASWASKGSAGGGPVEILRDSYRWRQGGLEIRVQGPRRLDLAVQLAPDFKLPPIETDFASRAQVKVEVDLEIAARDQEQVDGGHRPWQIDPSMVAMQFVNLNGEGSDHGEFAVTENTGVQAVVEVESGSIKTVYLKKLIRQDESGIWSVVGYDPR
ncbi:MAG: LolA family protein [Bacillota bacterium]